MAEPLAPYVQKIRTALGAAFDYEATAKPSDSNYWDPGHARGSMYDGVVDLDRMAQRIAADVPDRPQVVNRPTSDDPATKVAKSLSAWLSYSVDGFNSPTFSQEASSRLFDDMQAALKDWKESPHGPRN